MNRPIRHSLLATLLLAPVAFGTGAGGALVGFAKFLTVFFGLCFVLLLALSLFWSRPWRLDTPQRWGDAYRGGERRNQVAW